MWLQGENIGPAKTGPTGPLATAMASTKSLGIRGGDKPKKCNWVAVKSGGHSVEGKVYGLKSQFVVDTGVEITVVPGNLVYESQLLPETVEILGATGVPVETRMAEVEMDVLDKWFMKKVAVTAAGMLCDKVLFSVPMVNGCAERLLADACGSEEQSTKIVSGCDNRMEDDGLVAVHAITCAMKKRESAVETAEEVQCEDSMSPVSLEDVSENDGEVVGAVVFNPFVPNPA